MALATKTNVFEIHTKTLVKDRMHEKLLKWLFPLNSSWRPECQKKRVDGTNLKYLDRSSETATCRTLSAMEIQEQGNDSLEQTVLDREEALKPLPSNLDDAFAGTMERIERQTDSQFKLEAEAID
ncbi:hypothetical protein ACO22_06139 [Paracoccidioides brasiliensis]|uniref:Uncharacterized protein n=1 Tax=Paracoccidioides brasiliensis TaxID=121759 RepID=A0A1D2J8A3_PARBR|nr:hypothetical protein ACO22_06139 [Paracoccidioides brasiliensis]